MQKSIFRRILPRRILARGGAVLLLALVTTALAGAAEPAAPRERSSLIPMGAMTGKPSRDLIRHRLEQYAEVGVRQFLIYPRSGCEIPYMSDQWLEACRNVVECAEELDMDVWLYDEFNWPSGRCDGKVMEGHPEFCAKTLAGTKTKEGMTWEVTSVPEHADLLSPAAMRRFMALTHKRYEEHLSAYFGRRIKGIFTDEPSFKYGRPQTGNGTRLKLAYYDGIEEDYTKATGRNLRDDLSRAMHGEEVEGLWPTFYGLLGKQFQAAFFTPIREWCDRYGMVSTGHLMSEVPPVSSVKASGTPLACLRGLSLPGIDEIHTRVTFDRAEWGTLLLERNATAKNGRGGLAELFALGPADMPFGKLRQMIWLAALHGVSEYVLAVSPLDARGNLIKRQYFTAFTPVQTWFKQLPLLAEDSTRAAEIARAGFGPGVVIHYPWSLACEDAGRSMLGKKGAARSGMLYQVAKALIGNRWPVRIIDEGSPVPGDALAAVTITAEAILLAAPGGERVEVQSVDQVTDWMDRNVQRPFQVTGNLEPGNVLAEHLTDGRVCLLNLTDQDLVGLKLQTPSSKVRFDLPARGVRVFDPAADTRDDVAARRESAPEPRFRVQLDRPNLLRCRMKPVPDTDSHRFTFECDKVVSARLVVRAPDQLQSVCLDGKNVALPDACTDLPEGMREFYKVSGDLTLAPGKHRVELAGQVDDAPFLPVAFLAGDFGLFEGDVLRPLVPTAGCEDLRACGLRNYAGRVTLKTTLSVPDQPGEISLRLDTGEHIAEVVVDGRSLGTRGWAPFEWEIPTEFRGKRVPLEITLTPSIGAMFDRPDAIDRGTRWLKDYWPGDHAPFGVLSAPAWCIRDDDSIAWQEKAVEYARIMSRVKWTPVAGGMPKRGGYFEEGAEYTGVPYSSVKYVGRYIGFDIYLKTFLAAVQNPHSVLYTENLLGKVKNAECYYGKVCSSYTSYALQCGIWYVSKLHGPPYRDGVTVIEPQSAQSARPGDIIYTPPATKNGGSHVELVTEITRDGDGTVTHVRVEESYPQTTRNTNRSAKAFDAHISSRGRRLYRISDLDAWRGGNKAESFLFPNYEEDSATADINRVLLLDRGDWVPYEKEQAVKINVMDRDGLGVKALVIKRGNTVIEEINRPGKGVLERSFSTCGDYTAHCVMNDGSTSQACEFAVCDLDFSLPAREVSRDESWEIEFTSDNMNVIIAYLKSSTNPYDEHNVFVSEQDRQNGRVVIPAGLIQSKGTMQVWLIGENRYGRLKKRRDVAVKE